MNEWVSVKEELPEELKPVLLCAGRGEIRVGYTFINMNKKRMWCEGQGWTVPSKELKLTVTHWQELPKPPIEHPSLRPLRFNDSRKIKE